MEGLLSTVPTLSSFVNTTSNQVFYVPCLHQQRTMNALAFGQCPYLHLNFYLHFIFIPFSPGGIDLTARLYPTQKCSIGTSAKNSSEQPRRQLGWT